MTSSTTNSFWRAYWALSAEIRAKARKAYWLWAHYPGHPSLRFEPKGCYWSVRADRGWRAGGGLNHLLNYGYAVLLSTVLQKLFCVGLDPTFGISHVTRERSTPLAYDLMEPFRPCVDWRVATWVRQLSENTQLSVTPEFRKWVTAFPLDRVEYLDLTLDVRSCIEGVVRGFRRAVLTGDGKHYRPWTPKNSKWAG